MERYTRLAPPGAVNPDADTRTVDYLFSDESVGRDGHIVKNSAWRLENFNANPIFLWAHLDTEPPIGRVFNLRVAAGALRGSVQYAETEFADTIFELVRGGFCSGVSTSWQPLAYSPRPGGGGGVIFTDVDLLEISQVPLPALPTALATARARGLNVKPLAAWASRALDTGRCRDIGRPALEAIYRSASGSQVIASGKSGRAQRLARAKALRAPLLLTEEDRKRHARYTFLRNNFGYTVEQAARDIGIDHAVLQASIARVLIHAGDPMSASTASLHERKLSEVDKSQLRQTERHLAKAQRHHSTLKEHHDTLGECARTAIAAHRRVTSTLEELGEGRSARTTSTLAELGYDHHKITRAMQDLGAALEKLRKVHGDAEDTAGQAKESVDRAAASINGMIGSGSDEVH